MGLGYYTPVTPEQLKAATHQEPAPANSHPSTPSANGELGPAPDLEFPGSMLVEDLEKVHPEYDSKMLEEYSLLYDAGRRFRQDVDKFIVKRQVEKDPDTSAAGAKHYEARKDRSWYIPRGPGVIDWIIDSTFKKGLRVKTQEDVEEENEKAAMLGKEPETSAAPAPDSYWGKLNQDADGFGRSLNQVGKDAQRQIALYGRGYFYVHFDKSEGSPDDPDGKNARIRYMPASAIDDWCTAPNGKLLWVRTHTKDLERSTPFGPPDKECHYWTFLTDKKIVIYTASRKVGESWKKDQPALRLGDGDGSHDYGRLPIYEIPAPDGTHIMDRLFEVLVALFNREISITFALDQLAYAMLVFKLENGRDLSKIVASEMAAIKLGVLEDVTFKSPDPQIFDPLFKDSERLKKAVYEIIQASALTTASQTQNARQSATAKLLDRDLLHVLLVAYAESIKNTLDQVVEDLKKFRSDSADVELIGLDEFDATMDDIQSLLSGGSKAAQPVPGQKQVSDTTAGNSKEDDADE